MSIGHCSRVKFSPWTYDAIGSLPPPPQSTNVEHGLSLGVRDSAYNNLAPGIWCRRSQTSSSSSAQALEPIYNLLHRPLLISLRPQPLECGIPQEIRRGQQGVCHTTSIPGAPSAATPTP
jgi:hypothetical protein